MSLLAGTIEKAHGICIVIAFSLYLSNGSMAGFSVAVYDDDLLLEYQPNIGHLYKYI